MKKKILFFGLLIGLTALLTTCKKEYVEYKSIEQKEKEIIEQAEEIMPVSLLQIFEETLTEMELQTGYEQNLDAIMKAMDSLKTTIQELPGITLDDYKAILDSTFVRLNSYKSSQNDQCLGLGYSKSAEVTSTASGSYGAVVVSQLSGSGGGGINYTYDFVNLDRQIYYYKVCTYEHSFGIGFGGALEAGVGFTGIHEILQDIEYHGTSSGLNKFEGLSLGKSFGVSGSILVLFGIDVTVSIGTSQEAVGSFNQNNLLPCPQNLTVIENGGKGISFQVSGSLSAAAGAELLLALSTGKSGSSFYGIPGSYKKFANNRPLGGLRMAQELLIGEPLEGIFGGFTPFDAIASAIALSYGFKSFGNCAADRPSIGTLSVDDITSNTASTGGVVTSDRGSSVTARGVCWHTSPNPTTSNNKTVDGSGTGEFTSSITGLSPETTYYVRAYATNSAGTAYGQQREFTTGTGAGSAPVAAFTGSPTSGTAPLTVNFTDQSLNNPTSWQWNFGDGNTSTLQNTQHTYQNAGNYTVELTATNDHGSNTEVKTNFIQVNASGEPPDPEFVGSPTSGTAPLTVNFTDQSANSPTSWAWDFGDGTTSTQRNPSKTYQNAGTYTVKLTATNGHGSDTETKNDYINVTSGGGGTGEPCPGTPTVTDIDGNVYNTVLIGDQCWMAENLNTTRDAAGNNITRYCYNNDSERCEQYGGLYTWHTLMNGQSSSNGNPSGVQGICPAGWHVPSDAEWTQLLDFVVAQGYPNDYDNPNGAGNALKSCRQVNSPLSGDCNTSIHPRWNTHSTHHGFDEFGFSAFPSGWMILSHGNYVYVSLGYDGFWQTSTESSSTTSWYWFIRHYHGELYRFSNVNNKMFGKGVRCIRD
jgi:uncharacterized protein (TIGR02145 family)